MKTVAAAGVLTIALGAASHAGPPIRWGTVSLPSGRSLNVEVADTPELQARGYMFRDRVPEGEGMIFLMGTMDLHPFWMKNCRTGLDIIWLDDAWRIVHILANVPPCSADPCPTYSPLQKSRSVLELGPGQAAHLGLKIGDHLTYLPPVGPPPAILNP